MMMDAHAVHAALGKQGWLEVLRAAGIDEKQLSKKAGPCPACGGRDRYVFDNRSGRGDFFCRQCGPGDGFQLIMKTQGLRFAEAFKMVLSLAGLEQRNERIVAKTAAPSIEEPKAATVTRRVLQLIRETCAVEDCEPVRLYLASRSLWPLPQGHSLRAHSSVEYWHDKRRIGRFPALVGVVRDIAGD